MGQFGSNNFTMSATAHSRSVTPAATAGVVPSVLLYTAIMANQLDKEFEYYLAHQDEVVEKYNGKYVVIRDEQILGAYDDELTAITETQKSYKLGTFLVQKVSPGTEDYTQTFHSRVVFP